MPPQGRNQRLNEGVGSSFHLISSHILFILDHFSSFGTVYNIKDSTKPSGAEARQQLSVVLGRSVLI